MTASDEFRLWVASSAFSASVDMLAWHIVKGGKGAMRRCQEPKNDFLASMCPKWVPDTLSAHRWSPTRAPTKPYRRTAPDEASSNILNIKQAITLPACFRIPNRGTGPPSVLKWMISADCRRVPGCGRRFREPKAAVHWFSIRYRWSSPVTMNPCGGRTAVSSSMRSENG